MRDQTGWLFCRAPRDEAAMRLFCIPFAGGGASAFNAWPAALPERVEVQAVQLPGRETRYREPPVGDLISAAHGIADAIEPYLDRSYALFGYSMGALIAFEVLCELRRRGAPLPVRLFVAAMRAPGIPSALPRLTQLPDEPFIGQVRHYFQPPAIAWENLDFLQLVLPVLRADLAMCERYEPRSAAPFDCAIQAFAGLRDRSVPVSDVRAWRKQTACEFDLELFDEGHFFVPACLGRVRQALASPPERPSAVPGR